MGNWRRVKIVGTCDTRDVPALRKALDPGEGFENFHCLVSGGVCGLPNWADTAIGAIGNLAERDYSIENVAAQLGELAKLAPSLALKIHCGSDYEASKCVATVTLNDGQVSIGDPEIDDVPEISEIQMQTQFLREFLGR